MLTELDEDVREDVLDQLDSKDIAAAARELETDDAASLLEDLSEAERLEVLAELPAADRADIEQALAYPEDSAGRLMQRSLVKVPQSWSVGQVIDYCREAGDLPDDVYDLFVIDRSGRLRGSVPLGRMLRSKRPVPILDIVDPDIPSVPVTADQAEVAHLFRDQNLVSCPVVDGKGRLVGVIMVDDVVDVIDEEAEEDLLKMGGVGTDDMHANTVRTVRLRGVWLAVNLLTAVITSRVIGQFEDAIEKIVVLAVLMPIVASMGGNAGTQTVTVAVRALAMGELTPANALRFIGKEFAVGGLNGIIFATLMGDGGGALVPRLAARRGDRRGDDLQSRRRVARRHPDPDRAAEIRRRSRRILDGVPDHRHRRDRLPVVPRPGDDLPAVAHALPDRERLPLSA